MTCVYHKVIHSKYDIYEFISCDYYNKVNTDNKVNTGILVQCNTLEVMIHVLYIVYYNGQ